MEVMELAMHLSQPNQASRRARDAPVAIGERGQKARRARAGKAHTPKPAASGG